MDVPGNLDKNLLTVEKKNTQKAKQGPKMKKD